MGVIILFLQVSVLQGKGLYPYFIKLKDKVLITTEDNELMEQVHNTRKHMPTILSDTLSKEWMDEEVEKKRIEEIATFQIQSKEDL